MKNFLKRVLGISLVLIASTFAAEAQSAPSSSAEPSTVNQQARYWFRNTKFGLFIHWGRYSVPAAGEWVMETRHIPVSEDEKSAPQFNPQAFSAKEIVSLAKSAGMRYITITSKHHDATRSIRSSCWNGELTGISHFGKTAV